MIKAIKEFIQDFLDYRLIRRLNRIVELDGSHKLIIRSYNKEYEKELDSLVLHKLAEEMVKGDVTPEFNRGARAALMWRFSYLGVTNHKFPLSK